METYRVCLFGHRDQNDLQRVGEWLTWIIRELLRTKPYTEFLIGRSGEFDEYAASVIFGVLKEEGLERGAVTLVLPYTVADLAYCEMYYDGVLVPDCLAGVHPKAAITRRNRWMIEEADLVIVNVERGQGGAFTAMKYAEKQKKELINLAKGQGEG